MFAAWEVFKQNPTPGMGIYILSLFRRISIGTPDDSLPTTKQTSLL